MCETYSVMDFYATAWASHGVVHAEKTFAEASFKKETELKLFYAGDGAPSGCPVCGPENVCTCSAWLFTREGVRGARRLSCVDASAEA